MREKVGRPPHPDSSTGSSAAALHPGPVSLATGLALAAVNVVVGAIQPVITRYSALTIDPFLYCAGSVAVAAVCTALLIHRRGELAKLVDRSYASRLFAISMVGTVLTTLALIFGLRHINAVAATLLLESEPVYSLLMATVLVGERPKPRQLFATAVILGGIGLVFAGGAAFTPVWAALIVLITPLFWQSTHVLSLEVMPPLSSSCITGARYIYAAFVLTLLLLVASPSALGQLADPRALAAIIGTGIFVYFLGTSAWYAAINRLSLAWTTALVVPLVPLLSVVFAVIFLGERASARELAGIAIAIVGVLGLVMGGEHNRPRAAAGTAAEAIHHPIA